MRAAVLFIAIFLFAGCVSTETFNRTVGNLEARIREVRTENSILYGQMEKLQRSNHFTNSRLSFISNTNDHLIRAAKFLMDEARAIRGEWMMLQLRQAQVEKNFSDLRKKFKNIRKKITK